MTIILWGESDHSITWGLPRPKVGGWDVVAKADPRGGFFRDNCPPEIARAVVEAYVRLREGADLSSWANHKLAPPDYRHPIPMGETDV